MRDPARSGLGWRGEERCGRNGEMWKGGVIRGGARRVMAGGATRDRKDKKRRSTDGNGRRGMKGTVGRGEDRQERLGWERFGVERTERKAMAGVASKVSAASGTARRGMKRQARLGEVRLAG